MNVMVEKFIWIFLIIGTILYATMIKMCSLSYIGAKPSLKKGYDKIFFCLITIGNIPYIVIGIGMITGYTHTIEEYFQICINPIVLIFQISIISIACYLQYWIHFKGGAKFLEQHPGVFNGFRVKRYTNEFSEGDIKIFAIQGFLTTILFIFLIIFFF